MNAQLVHPASSQVVKRPCTTAYYEPDRDATFLAATLAYGLLLGHPFLNGNKRTAFFVHNQYRKACGLRGLAEMDCEKELLAMADRHIALACGSQAKIRSPEDFLYLGE
ncbi:hypothetical protein B0H11DRAFT_608863 [Mycena galericulata]|nr:hypothetical protein B0H11DRAFT_608863 [Mycena galericulata]